MAQSPNPEHRARLIREMSRDLNRTRRSTGSSQGSYTNDNNINDTISSAGSSQPVEEHGNSTRQSTSERLFAKLPQPASRRSSKAKSELDWHIDTSAINRAFPDFSKGNSDGESTDSIEIGRSGKKEEPAREFSSMNDSNMDFSPASIEGLKKSLGAARKTSNLTNASLGRHAQVRKSSGLRHAEPLSPPRPEKVVDYGSAGSAGSRESSGEHKSANNMYQAHVQEGDGSQISDNRPPTVTLTVRGTRFGGSKQTRSTSNALPTSFSASKDFPKTIANKSSASREASYQPQNTNTLSSGNLGTQHSFLLPNMPNIEELISGVFEDGTPVFNPVSNRSRGSRFTSNPKRSNVEHVPIAAISIPDDEQRILMSLQLLQQRVAELEKAKADAEAIAQTLQQGSESLEREREHQEQRPRRDSGLGSSNSDSGDEIKSRGHFIQNSRLRSIAVKLEEDLQASTQRSAVTEARLKDISKERDRAVDRLGSAFLTLEQLKAEKELLHEENQALRLEVSKLRAQLGLVVEETSPFNEPIRRMVSEENSRPSAPTPTEGQCRVLNVDESFRPLENVQQSRPTIKPSRNISNNTVKRRKTRLVVQEYSDSEESQEGVENEIDYQRTRASMRSNTTKLPPRENTNPKLNGFDVTMLTALPDEHLSDIRKLLEVERNARKQRGMNPPTKPILPSLDLTSHSIAGEISLPLPEHKLPRKSSLKKSVRPENGEAEVTRTKTGANLTTHSTVSNWTAAGQSGLSILEERNQRQGISTNDLTSAFIVPDVTLHRIGLHEPTLKLSNTTQQVFDNLANHEVTNCTICTRVLEASAIQATAADRKGTRPPAVRIPDPVPVTVRAAKETSGIEDPTIRPSQPPHDALAAVIKALEDELAHLRLSLTKYQNAYSQHDPALSKRKRKAVYDKIQSLLRETDVKSDQLYSLYDVLEGVKADENHEMQPEELEETLSRIGVDPARLRGGKRAEPGKNDSETSDESSVDEVELGRGTKKGKKATVVDGNTEHLPWERQSSVDEDDSLPWEGFESSGPVGVQAEEAFADRRSSWGF